MNGQHKSYLLQDRMSLNLAHPLPGVYHIIMLNTALGQAICPLEFPLDSTISGFINPSAGFIFQLFFGSYVPSITAIQTSRLHGVSCTHLNLRDLNRKAAQAIIGLFSVFIINKTRHQHFHAVGSLQGSAMMLSLSSDQAAACPPDANGMASPIKLK